MYQPFQKAHTHILSCIQDSISQLGLLYPGLADSYKDKKLNNETLATSSSTVSYKILIIITIKKKVINSWTFAAVYHGKGWQGPENLNNHACCCLSHLWHTGCFKLIIQVITWTLPKKLIVSILQNVTDWQDDYYNPLAHAHWGLITTPTIKWYSHSYQVFQKLD